MVGTDLSYPTRISRRHLLIGTAAAAAGLALYSGEIARHEIEITTHTVSLAHLHDAFRGFRIVQISDLHLDEYTEPFFLERIVRHVNSLSPDLVLLTGDFVTRGAFTFVDINHAVNRCAEICSQIACPERFAVLGNHDVQVGSALVIDALNANRIPVLVNQHIPIERNGGRLWICGVDDPFVSIPHLDLAIPPTPDGPVILMAHEPDYADKVIHHPRGGLVDLMLSGHTHGGQIQAPFLGPLVLPPGGKNYAEGFFTLQQMQLYVNRGIGTVGLPFRLNCPPEITVFTLQPSAILTLG